MSAHSMPRSAPRALVGALAGCALLVAGAPAADAAAKKGVRIVVPIPSAGDATYGVAQVKITKGAKVKAGKGKRVLKGAPAGLKIAGHSKNFKKLGKAGRIHVVASKVAGAHKNVRNVAIFVTHKRTKGAKKVSGTIEFTISGAVADTKSFWVKKVDARGTATVFQVRNIVSSAVTNWERYVKVLGLARALKAAHKAVDVNGRFQRKSTARAAAAATKLSTAGDKMSPTARKVFDLIFGTIRDPLAYQAAKRSPWVPAYIASDLGNPELAQRWAAVAEKLPLKVPDTYAAAAQVEKKFVKVTPPKISKARVSMTEGGNSTTQAATEVPPVTANAPREQIDVVITGTGKGKVSALGSGKFMDCPAQSCSVMFSSGTQGTLSASPETGSVFTAWKGCDKPVGATCVMDVKALHDGVKRTVEAVFTHAPQHQRGTLTVGRDGNGAGSVVSSPTGIECPSVICYSHFTRGQTITLTATPLVGSSFSHWEGCDTAHANTCTKHLTAEQNSVRAHFSRHNYAFLDDLIGFSHPQGVAVSDGKLWVTDTYNNQVFGYPTPHFGPPMLFGAYGNGDGEMYIPRQAAGNAAGTSVYVSDSYNNRVQQFDGAGAFVRVFSQALDTPRGIAVDRTSGRVAVADTLHNRVVVFEADGTFVADAGTPSSVNHKDPFTTPEGVAWDANGDLWVADTYADQIVRLDENLALVHKFTSDKIHRPTGVAVDPTGTVIVANWGHNTVEAFSDYGTHLYQVAGPGTDDGQVASPVTVAVDPVHGHLYVADEDDNAVQRFR